MSVKMNSELTLFRLQLQGSFCIDELLLTNDSYDCASADVCYEQQSCRRQQSGDGAVDCCQQAVAGLAPAPPPLGGEEISLVPI